MVYRDFRASMLLYKQAINNSDIFKQTATAVMRSFGEQRHFENSGLTDGKFSRWLPQNQNSNFIVIGNVKFCIGFQTLFLSY